MICGCELPRVRVAVRLAHATTPWWSGDPAASVSSRSRWTCGRGPSSSHSRTAAARSLAQTSSTAVAHAAPRAPRCVRRRARASRRGTSSKPLGDVADLPAGGLDLAAKAVRLAELPALARACCAPPRAPTTSGRASCVRGEGREPEHVERPSKQLVVAPLVHDCERVRRVEVVVERLRKSRPARRRARLGRVANTSRKRSACAAAAVSVSSE